MRYILILIIPMLSTCAMSQDAKLFNRDPFYNIMKGSFIGLQAADYFTTIQAVNRGAIEANPLFIDLVKHPVLYFVTKGTTTAGILYFMDLAYNQKPWVAKGTLIAFNVIYGLVVANNISVIIKLKHQ